MARFLKRNKKKADQGKLLNLAGRCYECARCGLLLCPNKLNHEKPAEPKAGEPIAN